MGLVDQVDKGLSGFAFTSQFANITPQGPLPYTTLDFLKHFSGIIAIIKFVAHIFSLPLMAVLRRGFGLRYVDEVHIFLSFLIWQVTGLISSFGSGWAAEIASPFIAAAAWFFLPIAFYHRHHAKKAALAGSTYSYYPGFPRLATVTVGLFRVLVKLNPASSLGRVVRAGHALTPEMVQGAVRRFLEPVVVAVFGFSLAVTGIATGFGMFLVWTACLLYVDETLSLRTQWELYLDQVDAQILAEEKQRLLSGEMSSTHGFSLASIATPPGSTTPAALSPSP